MPSLPARLPYRALAVLLTFAAALAAFAALRGAEPASPSAEATRDRPRRLAPRRQHRRRDRAAAAGGAGRAARDRRARRSSPARTCRRCARPATPRFYDRADGLLREALARRPGDADALVASAGVALSRHDFRRGLALARRARAARPEALAAYPSLVDALVELGRFGAAERTLQRLVDAKPGARRPTPASPTSASCTATSTAPSRRCAPRSARAGRRARASRTCSRCSARCELARGRRAAAESAHRAALAALPGYPAAEAGLARAAAARGDLAEAIRRWRALSGRLPLPEYVIGLGEAQLAAGRDAAGRARARAGRRAAAAARGGGVNLDAELAVYEADHGSPARALALAGRAWRAAPGLRAADARGWALTRSGRPAAGLRWAHRALRLGSRDAIFRYHAGIAALAAGRRGEGRRHLRLALSHGLRGLALAGRAGARGARGRGDEASTRSAARSPRSLAARRRARPRGRERRGAPARQLLRQPPDGRARSPTTASTCATCSTRPRSRRSASASCSDAERARPQARRGRRAAGR